MLKFGRQQASESRVDAGSARQSTSSMDDAQLIRKRARQRLIGAVILVVTAVIVLPMVLDSEPRPLNQDVAITIPGKDTPFDPKLPAAPKAPAKTTTADAGNALVGQSAGGAESQLSDHSVAPVTGGSVATARVTAAPTQGETTQAPMASPKQVNPSQAAEKSERGAAAAVAQSAPVSSAPAKSDDGHKAMALLEGKPDATAGNGTGRLFVQVGAFASEEKVKELQAKLKSAGIATFTERVKTGSGERIRLRLGPYAARSDAEAALGKVRAAGVNGAAVVQ